MSKVHQDMVAIGLNQGLFAFYNINTLHLQTIIQTSSGCSACVWYDSHFLTISYLSGVLTVWSVDGLLVREVENAPTGSIINMVPLPEANSFMVSGIMSVHQIMLSPELTEITGRSDLSFHDLAGCGINVSDNALLASGDMTGGLLFWKDDTPLPIHNIVLASSVRCLLWVKNFLLIGLLSGELYLYNASELLDLSSSTDVKMMHHFAGSVLCMQMNNRGDTLAVGTTTGNLHIFHIELINDQLFLNEMINVVAHKAQLVDGEKRLMEIWSLVWNPNDENIATVSEDKSCIISSKVGESLHVLTGHTTAVTSVDWKTLIYGDDTLATCADDCTVRIYNGCTFQLRHIIQPLYLYGWYTLTYLCINVKNNMIVCCTENGFVVAWDLQHYNSLVKCKLHTGSVEGLTLDKQGEFVFSTSADCVLNKFSIISVPPDTVTNI